MAVTANKPQGFCASAAMHGKSPSAGVSALLLLALFASPASAVEWRFTPSVGAQATYTDNANQSHSNPQDALILSVTPGFSLQSQGSRRVQASLQYGLNSVTRFSNDNSTNLYHNLGATGKAELIDDFLFIDGSASISQQLISLLGSPADATTNSANRTTVGTYSISPYIQKRFGTFAQAMVRYTLSGALIQNNAANNINSNAVNATLTSGTRFTDLSWGLNYSLRNTTIQGGQDAQFEHVGASLGYVLTRQIRAFGTLGYDHNDYSSASGASISGRSWTAGLGWSPNRRLSMDASFGHTYFGRTYGFDFNYRTHNSVWTAGYSEGTSDISSLLLTEVTKYLYLCPGANPGDPAQFVVSRFSIQPAPGCVLLASQQGLVPSLANGIFISKTLQSGVVWSKGKTTLGLNVFDMRRQYQQIAGLPEDETRGIVATYGYRLQPHTTLNGSLGYTNILVPAGLNSLTIARDDKLYIATLGVSHQFDSKLSGTLMFRRQQRESNDSASSFDENSIIASALMRF